MFPLLGAAGPQHVSPYPVLSGLASSADPVALAAQAAPAHRLRGVPGRRWGAAACERAVQARHPTRHLLQPR
jgi:hypothetical protein